MSGIPESLKCESAPGANQLTGTVNRGTKNGSLGFKPRTGTYVNCNVCGKESYYKPSAEWLLKDLKQGGQ